MSALARNNVTLHGDPAARPMVFCHGFGCDQSMWRHVWPAFAPDHRVVLLDHVGVGGSDTRAYDPARHSTLQGYADDVLDVLHELDLRDVVFVGHSVSAMIGVLAAVAEPDRFGALVLVAPSPRFLDDVGYTGGFGRADIEGLLETMESNSVAWSTALAPVVMGNLDRPELSEELAASFCRADPDIAQSFARVTFLSDNRADLAAVRTPSLILQCRDDDLAPEAVGRYLHEHLADSTLHLLDATGHCPNVSAPEETVAAIRAHLAA